MAEVGNNLKLMWDPAHTGIKENEEADEAAKEAMEKEVVKTDWSGWTRKKMFENRRRVWLVSGSEIVRIRTKLGHQ
jgi:hypothetical protein